MVRGTEGGEGDTAGTVKREEDEGNGWDGYMIV